MSSSQDPFRHRPKSGREVGDAPSIGRVTRMRNGASSKARTSKVTAIDGLDKRVNLTTLLGILLLGIGVVVAGLAAWAFVNAKRNHSTASATGNPADTVAAEQAILQPVPPPEVLMATVHSFLAARTPEALAPLIRKSDQDISVAVEKMAGLEKRDGALKNVRYLGTVNSRCLQVEAVVVNFEGDRNRLALLSPDAAGNWQVDFDGFDRHLSVGIDQILSGKAVDAKVRVYVSIDAYYNSRFKDDAKWACYGIASPDSDQLMFGYVARDSPQHEALAALIATKAELRAGDTTRSAMRRMILEIRHHPDGEVRQFEILRVLSDEWAMGAVPLDEIGRTPGKGR